MIIYLIVFTILTEKVSIKFLFVLFDADSFGSRDVTTMTTMNTYNCCVIFSFSLNVMLLTVIVRQAVRHVKDVPRTSANDICESQSVIRSTTESLYAMYGEGNFTDTDERLSSYIRSMTSQQGPGGRHLSNPSRVDYSQLGGSRFVDNLLKQRRNGFFVECGAFRGEDLSDTLFFELERNWTGILIEAHPEYHQEILMINRRALVLRACLSFSQRPGLVKFRLMGWESGVSDFHKNVKAADKTIPETHVQCFSLNSIMAAIGIRHIDFMVLDLEGSELPVLETIDWTRLSVDVFSIEYSDDNRLRKLEKIRHFFNQTHQRTGQRYREIGTLPLTTEKHDAQDVVFMRV